MPQVERAWQQFLTRFEPLEAGLDQLSLAEAFFVRTLLIHEYRRVLLRDPNLPKALLPAHWPGEQARQLCERLYRATLKRSEQYLAANVDTLNGRLTATPRVMATRFQGGLPPRSA